MYLLVFIQNLLVHLAEKILLMQPLTFGGDYPPRCKARNTRKFKITGLEPYTVRVGIRRSNHVNSATIIPVMAR